MSTTVSPAASPLAKQHEESQDGSAPASLGDLFWQADTGTKMVHLGKNTRLPNAMLIWRLMLSPRQIEDYLQGHFRWTLQECVTRCKKSMKPPPPGYCCTCYRYRGLVAFRGNASAGRRALQKHHHVAEKQNKIVVQELLSV